MAEASLGRRRWLAVTAGAFGSLDTAVNVAFPDITAAFDLAVADLQWIVVTYVLTYGALLVAAGRIGDAMGHDRVLRAGAVVSLVGLGACAGAPGFAVFLVGRVVQGVGAALVMAGAPALLTTSSAEARGRAVGWFQTAAMFGLAIGPIVGGPLIELTDWRSVYWFRLPVALALLVLAAESRRSPQPVSGDGRVPRADTVEIALNAAALAAMVGVISLGRTWGWTSLRLVALCVLAVGLAVAAIRRARTTLHPTIDRRALRRPGFLRANALTALANGAMFPTWLLVPTLLVDELGVGVIASGVVLATSPALSAVVARWVGGRVDDRPPRTFVVIGLAAEAVGMATIAVAGSAGTVLGVVAGLALTGAGLGLFTVPNMHEVMSALPDDRQGVAGGLSLMMRTLGIVTSVAVASAVFDPIEAARGFDDAFVWVFAGSAALLLLATAVPGRVSNSSSMRVTGLCGGIGAGKSTVAALLADHGARVIDVDRLGRDVIEPGARAYDDVVALFGDDILAAGDVERPPIDRGRLASIVFADSAELRRLEAVSHPAINAELDELLDAAAAAGDDWVVLDMAVLVESTLGRDLPSGRGYDTIVVVEAPEPVRIDRLVESRGMDPADAAARLARQSDDAQRRAVADIVIVNDSDLEDLRARVDEVVDRLRSPLA